MPLLISRPLNVPRGTFPVLHTPPIAIPFLQPYSDPKPMSARIFAIANQKGGVAKTTTAINLSTALAMLGFRVLLLDCDPQSNATSGLGIDRKTVENSVYDVLVGDCTIAEAAIRTRVRNLYIVPASKNLIGANIELVQAEDRAFRLRKALHAVTDQFDFIIMDCPPALDLLTLNALAATRYLLVPMQAEYFALEGVSELLSTVERVKNALNPELVVEGVLLTMYDDRTNLAQQVAENLRGYFGDKLLKTTIPRNIRLAEAPSYGMPVLFYDPRSRGSDAYRALAAELLQRLGISPPVQPEEVRENMQENGQNEART
jgi:chromosome partitioning protein